MTRYPQGNCPGVREENAALAAKLERFKCRWQAEALDDAAEAFEIEGCHVAAAQALRCSAAELRRQAEETAVCPGPDKCDDPGCPAHYAGLIGDPI